MSQIVWDVNGIPNPPSFKRSDRQFDDKDVLRDADLNTIVGNINFVNYKTSGADPRRVFCTNNDSLAGWYNYVNVSENNTSTTKNSVIADNFYATSDRRMKADIVPYSSDNSILDLEVKRFKWKDSGKESFGFIAQEVKELFPEIVDGDESQKGSYLAIQESKLAYLLLIELKKIRKELDRLKANNRG